MWRNRGSPAARNPAWRTAWYPRCAVCCCCCVLLLLLLLAVSELLALAQLVFMSYFAVPILKLTGAMFPPFRDMFEAGLDENRR